MFLAVLGWYVGGEAGLISNAIWILIVCIGIIYYIYVIVKELEYRKGGKRNSKSKRPKRKLPKRDLDTKQMNICPNCNSKTFLDRSQRSPYNIFYQNCQVTVKYVKPQYNIPRPKFTTPRPKIRILKGNEPDLFPRNTVPSATYQPKTTGIIPKQRPPQIETIQKPIKCLNCRNQIVWGSERVIVHLHWRGGRSNV